MLTPLGNRVLILPDTPPDKTDSGLYLRESWRPEQTGHVVAVGPTCREAVKVGDYVVFAWQVGQEVVVNLAQRYLLMRETDILAVYEPDAVEGVPV